MTGVKLLGVGKFAPETAATNDDYSKIVETNDEWITTRTGIKKRHLANGEPTWYMGAMAAKDAIADAGIDPQDIGLIIVTTITGDYITPSTSCIIQRELGAVGSMCIDINCACAGFVYGFDMAKRYLETDKELKYVLLVSSEELSKITDYADRATCVLFGDGAAAAVLQRNDDAVYASFLGADGNGAMHLLAKGLTSSTPFTDGSVKIDDGMPPRDNHFIYQDGREVYKFATKALPHACEESCKKLGITPDNLDLIIPHQANKRIIETAAKNLKISMDKFFLNLEEYGNTSSASVPIALCDAVKEGRIKHGDKICLVGFGAGLTYGGVVFEY